MSQPSADDLREGTLELYRMTARFRRALTTPRHEWDEDDRYGLTWLLNAFEEFVSDGKEQLLEGELVLCWVLGRYRRIVNDPEHAWSLEERQGLVDLLNIVEDLVREGQQREQAR